MNRNLHFIGIHMRFLLSWAFYWLGDTSYKISCGLDWLSYKVFANLYQWCMQVAAKLQGNGKGPWVNSKE